MRKLLASLCLVSAMVWAGDEYRGDTGNTLTNSTGAGVSWTNTSPLNAYYLTSVSGSYANSFTGTVKILRLIGTKTNTLYSASVTNCLDWTWEPLNRYHVTTGQVIKVTDQGTNGVIKFEFNF